MDFRLTRQLQILNQMIENYTFLLTFLIFFQMVSLQLHQSSFNNSFADLSFIFPCSYSFTSLKASVKSETI